MLIIVDARAPEEAKKKLRKYGELLEIETAGITYPAISGHPDIFFTPTGRSLIVAPNLPEKYLHVLDRRKISWRVGEKPVGSKYPESAAYNAAVAENLIVHNFDIADQQILEELPDAERIHVSQGYTRCNLVFLNPHMAITSDLGILKKLQGHEIELLYAEPSEISLRGFGHGFFGGTCGTDGVHFFILGSLAKIRQGREIAAFIERAGLIMVELCNAPLIDGGSIFFLRK